MVTFNGVNVVQGRFPNNEVDYVSANRLKATCPASFEEPCWDEFKVVYENNEDLFNLQVIKKWWDDAYPNNWARLVIDFFPYGQMDRDTGVHLFSLKYVAEIINDLNFRAVYICDPHSNVLPALLKHCHVIYPVEDHLEGEYYSNPGEKIPYDLMFYPDNGAAKKYSEIINLPYRFGNKKRDLRTGEIISYEIIAEEEDIKDKRILIVDDICAGGRTFREAATALRKMGAKKVDLYITHMMPQGTQSDIHDSFDVVNILGISHSIINIGESVSAITKQVWDRRAMDNVYPNKDMEINLPARIRMSVLHAVGQCIGGRVINTSNLSEDMVGYATQFGDNAGSYAPIQGLTVTEVKHLGKYVACLLYNKKMLDDTVVKERMADMSWETHPVDGHRRLIELIDKTPADGLQPQSDEERLGITYKQIDDFIRLNKGDDEVKEKIRKKYLANKFKLEIVQMPQPDFSHFPNYVKGD